MTVNRLDINAIALAIGLAFSTGALAQGISKNDYTAGKDTIASEFKSNKARCASLSGNANDICMTEAKGREQVAAAELDASYKPTAKSRHQVELVRAGAAYAVSKERCDDSAGQAKDVCLKKAQAAETVAKADAEARMKTSDADAAANDKAADAHRKADDQAADANKEAADKKLDAQYGVAKQQCDTYAGGAKDLCLDKAKARFAKP